MHIYEFVFLSIKLRTDGTLNYVRQCKNVHGELEYNASWGLPFSSPAPAAGAVAVSSADAPHVQETLALMPAPADAICSRVEECA